MVYLTSGTPLPMLHVRLLESAATPRGSAMRWRVGPSWSGAGTAWRAQLLPLPAGPGIAGPLLPALGMMSTLFASRRVRSSAAGHVHLLIILISFQTKE